VSAGARAAGLRAAAGAALCTAAVLLAAPAAAQPDVGAPDAAKPVAPFSLEAEALGVPAVGVPMDVRVRVGSRVMLEDVEVRISADPGLALDAGGFTLYAPSASPEEPAEWRITVVPVEEGAHRLRLFGEALVDGEPQVRSVVETIRVGTGADGDAGARGAEGDSAVRGADRDTSARGDAREAEPGSRRKAGAAEGSPGSDEGRADPERVIRLPAIERP